jgi:hypothetical protein
LCGDYTTVYGVHRIHFWNRSRRDFDFRLGAFDSKRGGDLQRLTYGQVDYLMEVGETCTAMDRQYVITGRQIRERKGTILFCRERAHGPLIRICQGYGCRVDREPCRVDDCSTK